MSMSRISQPKLHDYPLLILPTSYRGEYDTLHKKITRNDSEIYFWLS